MKVMKAQETLTHCLILWSKEDRGKGSSANREADTRQAEFSVGEARELMF